MISNYFHNTIKFQKKNNAIIFLGEFSCPRWLEKEGGNIWIEDVIEVCEEHNISWAYHAWREATCWDAEKSNTDMNDDKRYDTTPRLSILKKYFNFNSHGRSKN